MILWRVLVMNEICYTFDLANKNHWQQMYTLSLRHKLLHRKYAFVFLAIALLAALYGLFVLDQKDHTPLYRSFFFYFLLLILFLIGSMPPSVSAKQETFLTMLYIKYIKHRKHITKPLTYSITFREHEIEQLWTKGSLKIPYLNVQEVYWYSDGFVLLYHSSGKKHDQVFIKSLFSKADYTLLKNLLETMPSINSHSQ